MLDIRDVKLSIDSDVAKRIFWNKPNAIEYLINLGLDKREIARLDTAEVYSKIVSTWNYESARSIIRNVFKNTKKYQEWKNWEDSVVILLNEWKEKWFWEVKWPFSQWAFDNFVQSLNSENTTRDIKDEKVKLASVKYRRIKELNTVRNDFLETLIFEKNENIIPTLSHSRWVDFFIDGISYDQKVAKSPTSQFIKDFWDDRKKIAIEKPELVAEYLYKHQDEGRFWAWPRLYVVYLDEDISPVRIKEIINWINLSKPLKVTFDYEHEVTEKKTYQTQCFVILLFNQ